MIIWAFSTYFKSANSRYTKRVSSLFRDKGMFVLWVKASAITAVVTVFNIPE